MQRELLAGGQVPSSFTVYHQHQHHHHHHYTNMIEVQRIVALAQVNYSMIDVFFANLTEFTREQAALLKTCKMKKKLMLKLRLEVQARLNFLSFVYSTLGSPRDFELSRFYCERLWDSLIQFEDFNDHRRQLKISIKDDLFNWFLNQAKSKDQHAINIDTFKFIFIDKMPLINTNSFSQNALYLYQELFKIYKFSVQQQQQQQQRTTVDSGLHSFKQIESSSIDLITKLALRSTNGKVSQLAIQFLNAHYTQTDTILNVDYQTKFVSNIMKYLNESIEMMAMIRSPPPADSTSMTYVEAFLIIQRAIVLLSNHLDLYQRRLSYSIRSLQLQSAESATLSHLKQLELIESYGASTGGASGASMMMTMADQTPSTTGPGKQFITLVCSVNSTQFKFCLTVCANDCLGDLKVVFISLSLSFSQF